MSDYQKETISGYKIVIHELRKRVDSLGRARDRQQGTIEALRVERNGLKHTLSLISKAVVSSGEEQRLFEERNRRSWK